MAGLFNYLNTIRGHLPTFFTAEEDDFIFLRWFIKFLNDIKWRINNIKNTVDLNLNLSIVILLHKSDHG